ncbi:MAG: hypothetical protein A2381_01665 [Bdellovibrionales bacterium RIFOXYB1_FULL_37_110]|nr:MAG: hypothetical protein A2417_15850 [Bdellovibrionales bacterium RIFOXYC1_FULL_37_79]OFZ58923.1 MAG: hypothetical protein A2381_01665 [Bdellovibrionales bacterium RIFOXYB1_FULL_37_110]OFZ64631.1 MAG: hypothetical protein A2577_13270 [Bdellovibrionales bacterium RIFOXYD1_FULL_36_51]
MTDKITDEQILGYLMGDTSPDLLEKINLMLKDNQNLVQRIESIRQIQKQVKLAPTECYVPSKQKNLLWKVAPTGCLLIISFLIGLLVEARFILLGSSDGLESGIYMEKEISRPLVWEENNKSALL